VDGMKSSGDRPFADPEAAARKLIEIANTVEAVQDGRLHIEKINAPFLQAGGSPAEYGAGLALAVAKGWFVQTRVRDLCSVHPIGRGPVRVMPWSTLFEDPILLPNGKTILALQQAADYILKMLKAEQNQPAWQAATEALITAAENRGPLLLALACFAD
jgi:hypothetical protein